jgi:peptidoglycan/LPS O-acetylase OafA/YrhL
VSGAAAGQRLPSLTSLRWFAASAVFLSHADRLFAGTSLSSFFARIAPQGVTGVSFFFILSGFVLAWAYRPGDAAGAFYRRRFARIVPAYVVMCLVALIVPPLTYNPIASLEDLATRVFPLTLLQAWIPSRPWYFGGNSVSWSLSVEVFFYALFPLLIAPLLRLSRRGTIGLLAALVAAGEVVPLLLANTWVIYINPVFRLTEFVIGIALAALLLHGMRLRVPVAAAAALALAAYVAAGMAPDHLMFTAVTLVPFSLLILTAAESDVNGRFAKALHFPWLVRLGQWSFSFYLAHALVVSAFVRVAAGRIEGGPARLVVLLATYAAAIAAAYVLFRFVEHPFERRIRHGGTAMPDTELGTATASA